MTQIALASQGSSGAVFVRAGLTTTGCQSRQARERVANVEPQVQQAEAPARDTEDSAKDTEETRSGCHRMPAVFVTNGKHHYRVTLDNLLKLFAIKLRLEAPILEIVTGGAVSFCDRVRKVTSFPD